MNKLKNHDHAIFGDKIVIYGNEVDVSALGLSGALICPDAKTVFASGNSFRSIVARRAKTIFANNNKLTSVDFMDGEYVELINNKLVEIKLDSVRSLFCGDNPIRKLRVAKCRTINLSNVKNLEYLYAPQAKYVTLTEPTNAEIKCRKKTKFIYEIPQEVA